MGPVQPKRLPFRTVEEIKKAILHLSPEHGQEIDISTGLFGNISEGEPLIHPKFFEILEVIREQFDNPISFVSNGIMLTPSFIGRLSQYRPIRAKISFHSSDPDNWCNIFNSTRDNYDIVRQSFPIMHANGIDVDGVVVALPNMVGYDDIKSTCAELAKYVRTICIFSPGYTEEVPDDLKDILSVDHKELSRFVSKLNKELGIYITLMADVLKPLELKFGDVMLESYDQGFRNVAWLFSEAVYEQAKVLLERECDFVPSNHYARMVKNYTYGGNVIVSGLLMVNDFKVEISRALNDIKGLDLVVLPILKFADRYGYDMLGTNYSELDKFNVEAWHIDCGGYIP